MSRTIRKYQIRDRRKQYKRTEKHELKGKYYTDVSKSHERKINKRGLREDEDSYE